MPSSCPAELQILQTLRTQTSRCPHLHHVKFDSLKKSETTQSRYPNFKLFKDSKIRAKLEAMHVLGFGEALDIAQMAVYLASDESRLVTGQIFPVDSGLTVK